MRGRGKEGSRYLNVCWFSGGQRRRPVLTSFSRYRRTVAPPPRSRRSAGAASWSFISAKGRNNDPEVDLRGAGWRSPLTSAPSWAPPLADISHTSLLPRRQILMGGRSCGLRPARGHFFSSRSLFGFTYKMLQMEAGGAPGPQRRRAPEGAPDAQIQVEN